MAQELKKQPKLLMAGAGAMVVLDPTLLSIHRQCSVLSKLAPDVVAQDLLALGLHPAKERREQHA